MTENRKISMRQLQILIILSAMGTGVIVLPRRAAEFLPEGAQDGWIIAIGLTVVAMIFGALVSTAARLSQKAAEQSCGATGLSFIQSVSVLLTKPVAYTIGAVMWAKLVFAAGLELRLFLQMTRDVMLPRTPLWVVGAVMLLACAYAAVKGMEARARVGEVLFALMILPFLFMFVVAVMDADFSNLQPIFVNDARSLIYGTLRLGFILTGLECLLLVSPYVPRKKSLTRSVVGALGFAGIIITGITIVTIAKLGRGTDSAAWPVLAMMDAINLPGSFIERQEALMFGFWIITAFVLGNALLFFGGLLVNDVFKKTTLRTGVFLTATAVFFISILPISREAIYARMDYMYLSTGLFFLVILPVCLILVSKITLWGAKAAAKPISFFIFIAFSTVILSGCWDRVEIENRAFVVAMGIDAEDDGYKVTLSVPVFGEKGTEGFPLYGETGENGENGENGETGENGENKQPAFIKTSYGKTLSEALKNLDSKEARHLYYGQTKLLLLGEGILGNSASVESVIATLTNRLKAPGRVHVAAAENAADILSAKPPGEILPGSYVSEIYRDKNKIGGQSFALNFERLKGSVEKSHELCQHRKKIRGFRRFSEVWHMRMDDFST
ncbi:MAG: endospore germination permease, partial [Defluviitaleaceae bacterium]|nr:endospore germination permease [Defluviitaleaceae bacterium]